MRPHGRSLQQRLAEERLAGKGWLPPILRAPVPAGQEDEAEAPPEAMAEASE